MCILSANCSQAKANCRKQWCMLLRAILSVPNGRSITRWFGTQMNFTEKCVSPTYINLYKDPRQCLRRDHLFYNHSFLLELVLKFGQWNIHHALLEIFLQMGGAFEWEMSSIVSGIWTLCLGLRCDFMTSSSICHDHTLLSGMQHELLPLWLCRSKQTIPSLSFLDHGALSEQQRHN